MILGSGSTSTVVRRGKYAVKSYGSSFDLAKVVREIYFLSHYKHQNIIQLHKVYVNRQNLCLKLDFGGICLAKLKDEEDKVTRLVQVIPDILAALNFLHKNGICHRDVSPYNILCRNVTKLCDFGSSIKCDSYNRKIMNKYFDSPEEVKTSKSDIYSFGSSICYYYGMPDDAIVCGHTLKSIITKCVKHIDERATADELLIFINRDANCEIVNAACADEDLYKPIANDGISLGYEHFKILRKRKYLL